MIPGKGIGSELCDSVERVFKETHVPITFDRVNDFNIWNKDHKEQLLKNR